MNLMKWMHTWNDMTWNEINEMKRMKWMKQNEWNEMK
jgi:hypothetical protein